MTTTTPRESERTFQGAVLDLARRQGWLAFHAHDSRRQVRPGVLVGDADAAGYPDLTLVRERLVIAELKTDRGRVSQAQEQWLAMLRYAGVETYLWRPRDWDTIVKVLRRRA